LPRIALPLKSDGKEKTPVTRLFTPDKASGTHGIATLTPDKTNFACVGMTLLCVGTTQTCVGTTLSCDKTIPTCVGTTLSHSKATLSDDKTVWKILKTSVLPQKPAKTTMGWLNGAGFRGKRRGLTTTRQAVAKPDSLKIAQPFMAGNNAIRISKSRQGRQAWWPFARIFRP
jgi:hypothetical protein